MADNSIKVVGVEEGRQLIKAITQLKDTDMPAATNNLRKVAEEVAPLDATFRLNEVAEKTATTIATALDSMRGPLEDLEKALTAAVNALANANDVNVDAMVGGFFN